MPLVANYPQPELVAQTEQWDQITPTFSVVTATYRRKAEITQLLKSLSKQLELDTTRFEHIICDNASDDDTEEAVVAHMRSHEHIAMRYYKQSENFGLDKNVQDTLRLARGEYIWFVADDDDIVPGKLVEVADACDSSQLPLVIVRANMIPSWDIIPNQNTGKFLVEIDPGNKQWSSVIYATCFLASMVFRRDQILQHQHKVYPVFGTSYTPWALGVSIISASTKVGFIDSLCTLGNANFDGNIRFPSYAVLVKGRVLVWDQCAAGAVRTSLKPKLVELSAAGWRAAATGELNVGETDRELLQEYFQAIKILGPVMLLSLPWILVSLLVPRRARVYLNRLRKSYIK